MRAFTLDAFGSKPGLRDDLPDPAPGGNEVLVRVHASSVNPVDMWIAAGALAEMAEHEFPVVLGRDYAGVVEQAGDDVSRFAVGDEVYGYVPHIDPRVHEGAWAELIAVPEDGHVSAKPASVDFAQAGAAALAAITTVAAFDALSLKSGEKVLVIGATGGVGSFFVQLAADAGAHVIAPALAGDHDYLTDLGAKELVDREDDVSYLVREAHPEGIDAILDCAGGSADESLLRDGGRIASPTGGAGEGPGRFNVMAEATQENLERVAALVDAGTLRVPIQRSYPLEQAGETLVALPTTHTQGKLSITIL
jgi:NADPH:quinone reductase